MNEKTTKGGYAIYNLANKKGHNALLKRVDTPEDANALFEMYSKQYAKLELLELKTGKIIRVSERKKSKIFSFRVNIQDTAEKIEEKIAKMRTEIEAYIKINKEE
jgi:hypothetical protein